MLKSQLEKGLQTLGIESTPEQVALLIEYLALLEKWNKVYNLTAIRDPQEMLVKHLLDSLAIVPHLLGQRWIDVGTGGGLPGIPLAIMFPEKQVDLLDSNSKKTRFLIQVKAELGLTNTQVIHDRVENYQPVALYDGVISRAFASMNDMLNWTNHLLKEGGAWWAMKGQKEFEDLTALPGQVSVQEVVELSIPNLDAERMLLKVIKQG
ncbi:16S rRNA (guanine(527)-N(7))-methyltransferase [hydrothermal vent metagenome]|uniref:16S rRNA (Guanine(527)-N(7))-methyltransferase n=1 Tax=hydrothermal vent metagenome TaxID=652676 RepID=A0A3B0WJ76_9ZZZZ